MGIPKHYCRLLEKIIPLPDGGSIKMKIPSYLDQINHRYGVLMPESKKYLEYHVGISELIQSGDITNETSNNEAIKIVDRNGIPPEAYIEYKVNMEIQSTKEILSYISECKDKDGNIFTIDSLDEYEYLDQEIKNLIVEGFLCLLSNKEELDSKNLNTGVKSKPKHKKKAIQKGKPRK